MLKVRTIADYEAAINKLLEIEAYKEENVSWEEIAKILKLGSETSARRLYKKLTTLYANPPKGIEHSDFTREVLQKKLKATKTSNQRYIISTITALSDTNQNAFLSLFKASKELNAKLILLLGRSHNKPLEEQIPFYDPWLKKYAKDIVFVTEFTFNKSIMAVDLQINPQQLNPLTGLSGINWGEDCSSVIVASTQLCLEPVARGNGRTPRLLVGTGSISKPNYRKETRVGVMAEQNHDCGAVILEVLNNKKFYLRTLEIDEKTGTFFDIANGVCKEYSPIGSKKARAKGWILGDKHIGHDDEKVWCAQKKLAKIINPEEYILHDVIDGSSGSHHTWNKLLKKIKSPFLSIQEELTAVAAFLQEMRKLLPKSKGFMIDSNHHDHITQYLQEGRYIKDAINFEIAHRMIVDTLNGKNPLQLRCDPKNEFVWTLPSDDYYIEGVNIAMHGHRGANGSRGNIKNIATIEKSAVIAHSHTPGIYRGIMQVGHSSSEKHGYNEGPSSWITADGIIYKGGLKQLIMYIDGEFCI